MAAAAFAHLRARIEEEHPAAGRSVLLRPELIVRQSTNTPVMNASHSAE
jgi:DNA-binding LacI/PurR family transcriptional regulator